MVEIFSYPVIFIGGGVALVVGILLYRRWKQRQAEEQGVVADQAAEQPQNQPSSHQQSAPVQGVVYDGQSESQMAQPQGYGYGGPPPSGAYGQGIYGSPAPQQQQPPPLGYGGGYPPPAAPAAQYNNQQPVFGGGPQMYNHNAPPPYPSSNNDPSIYGPSYPAPPQQQQGNWVSPAPGY